MFIWALMYPKNRDVLQVGRADDCPECSEPKLVWSAMGQGPELAHNRLGKAAGCAHAVGAEPERVRTSDRRQPMT